MNKAEIREKDIMALLRVSGKVSVAEAMALLDVSESTVRRLFCKLEADGLAVRTYRGISINTVSGARESYSFERNELYRSREKVEIGEAAEALIEEGDIIYLDSGTTVLKLCAAIAHRCAVGTNAEKYAKVTVFTNSLANLNLLKDYMNVCLIGGEYRPHRQDFCGYLTDEVIKKLHFTKCFVGADGYSVENGLTASDFDTARINQLVVAGSDKRILLADTSKAGRASVIHYADIESVDTLVTNKWLDNEIKTALLQKNINVIEA